MARIFAEVTRDAKELLRKPPPPLETGASNTNVARRM